MDTGAKSSLEEGFAAAFDWWREAGVEWDYADKAQPWLAEAEPAAASQNPGAEVVDEAPRRAERTPRPRGDSPVASPIDLAAMPMGHEAFIAWWLAEPSLDAGRVAGRVLPRGMPGSETMVLVPEPERDDTDTLLSGPQGRLLDGFLSAAGIAPENVYLASILPRPTPHPDWPALKGAGITEVLARHVALAAPRRLIALTGNILSLIGHGSANNPAGSSQFQHEQGTVPLLLGRDLEVLLERPRWKAGLWQAWLEWDASG